MRSSITALRFFFASKMTSESSLARLRHSREPSLHSASFSTYFIIRCHPNGVSNLTRFKSCCSLPTVSSLTYMRGKFSEVKYSESPH